MRGVFDDDQLEPAQPRHDTELTLGSGTLLLIFFGLVALCGLCFGMGYAVGHRSAPLIASAAQPALPPPGSFSKPSATAPPVAAPAAPADAAAQAATTTSAPNSAPAVNPGASPTAVAPSLPASPTIPPVQPQVRPAFPATSTPPPSTQPSAQPAAQSVQPALPPPVLLMVQIAAVSKIEDADTLISALRRRGYTVTARREPADNLIHVRIGPFTTREDALRWQQKLLNDGYNAIIQP